jgi:hypothetical protein
MGLSHLKSSISARRSRWRPTRKLDDPAMLPEAARLPDPVLLAVEERLLWRVYDWDLLDGTATGIFRFLADFHSELLLLLLLSCAFAENETLVFFARKKRGKISGKKDKQSAIKLWIH